VAPHGPPDRLDEPMTLSIADKAALVEAVDSSNEHVQWELRKALEKIHSHAGNQAVIGGGTPAAEDNPFDGMDAYSSAMLLDLAQSVMPTQPIVATGAKYTPEQRRAAINRWLDKRSRRHLTSQTKYKKMKDVAVGKSRCKGGKFISKAERARLEAEAAAAAAMPVQPMPVQQPMPVADDLLSMIASPLSVSPQLVAAECAMMGKDPRSQDAEWMARYELYTRSEE